MGRFDSFKYCEYCGLEPSLRVEKKMRKFNGTGNRLTCWLCLKLEIQTAKRQ